MKQIASLRLSPNKIYGGAVDIPDSSSTVLLVVEVVEGTLAVVDSRTSKVASSDLVDNPDAIVVKGKDSDDEGNDADEDIDSGVVSCVVTETGVVEGVVAEWVVSDWVGTEWVVAE